MEDKLKAGESGQGQKEEARAFRKRRKRNEDQPVIDIKRLAPNNLLAEARVLIVLVEEVAALVRVAQHRLHVVRHRGQRDPHAAVLVVVAHVDGRRVLAAHPRAVAVVGRGREVRRALGALRLVAEVRDAVARVVLARLAVHLRLADDVGQVGRGVGLVVVVSIQVAVLGGDSRGVECLSLTTSRGRCSSEAQDAAWPMHKRTAAAPRNTAVFVSTAIMMSMINMLYSVEV